MKSISPSMFTSAYASGIAGLPLPAWIRGMEFGDEEDKENATIYQKQWEDGVKTWAAAPGCIPLADPAAAPLPDIQLTPAMEIKRPSTDVGFAEDALVIGSGFALAVGLGLLFAGFIIGFNWGIL